MLISQSINQSVNELFAASVAFFAFQEYGFDDLPSTAEELILEVDLSFHMLMRD